MQSFQFNSVSSEHIHRKIVGVNFVKFSKIPNENCIYMEESRIVIIDILDAQLLKETTSHYLLDSCDHSQLEAFVGLQCGIK